MGCSIAIDGTAGAGKSTIARRVAEELSFIYVDTGAMYRAVALYLLENGTDTEKEGEIARDCKNAAVSIQYQDGEQQVLLNGKNVNALLRTEEVSQMASKSSPVPEVRAHLLQLQRTLARENNVVMDGRDIGTVILPEAEAKIFLTASPEVRARRRYLELKERGEDCDEEEIRQSIILRDVRDIGRAVSPLKQAPDAVLVDSSEQTVDQVVEKILQIYREKTERP
ncbi:MAG: (d)CMP kinase [Clostridiales bacterium]|nr:(d)CMP kinase [Clostridiales bacterium]